MSVPAEQVLPNRFAARIQRLTLGIEPLDAALGRRVRHLIQILVETAVPPLPRPQLLRHLSGLFVLVPETVQTTTLTLRLCDVGESTDPPGWRAETNRRRLVPRRLRIDIPATAASGEAPAAQRVRRPILFPGAAYPVSDAVTGLRGRVERASGEPERWARVAAYRPEALPGDAPVGVAHGDDRGEFLLLLGSAATPRPALEHPFELRLSVFPSLPPVLPPSSELRARDGLWDLPVEDLSQDEGLEPLTDGTFPPRGWGAAWWSLPIELVYGRLVSGRPPLTP